MHAYGKTDRLRLRFSSADRLSLGPLIAVIERPLDHPPAGVMPAGDRHPMHLPVIPDSACDAPDLQHFCHIFETLVIQKAVAHLQGAIPRFAC